MKVRRAADRRQRRRVNPIHLHTMTTASSSKKRKRGADDAHKINLHLSTQPAAQVGPVLASFPALQPPPSTAFLCYHRPGQVKKDEVFASQDTLLAGETDTVEFSNEGQLSSTGCSYLVGVHDKRTNTTTFRPAPLHVLARQVKALKSLMPIEASNDERMALRNSLGEAFGTKKAKAAIRARERNRVDVDAMKAVAGHLQDTILENTDSLPTLQQAKTSADSSRLVPPYNADAERPDDVYALHDIIPEAEFNAISIAAFKSADSNHERIALLPYKRSNWVNQHLHLLFSASKLKKTHVCVCLLMPPNSPDLTWLGQKNTDLHIRDAGVQVGIEISGRQTGVAAKTVECACDHRGRATVAVHGDRPRHDQVSLSLIVSIIRAAETVSLSERRRRAEQKRIDDYATDTTLIAHDLSTAPTKLQGREIGRKGNQDEGFAGQRGRYEKGRAQSAIGISPAESQACKTLISDDLPWTRIYAFRPLPLHQQAIVYEAPNGKNVNLSQTGILAAFYFIPSALTASGLSASSITSTVARLASSSSSTAMATSSRQNSRFSSLKVFKFAAASKPPPLPPKDPYYLVNPSLPSLNHSLSPDSSSSQPGTPLSAQYATLTRSPSPCPSYAPSRVTLSPPSSSSLSPESAGFRKGIFKFSSIGRRPKTPKTTETVSSDTLQPSEVADDPSISLPRNFQHNIHVDEGFTGLPPTWSASLTEAGFSEEEIAAINARRAASRSRSTRSIYSLNKERAASPPDATQVRMGRPEPQPRSSSLQRGGSMSSASQTSLASSSRSRNKSAPSRNHSESSSSSGASATPIVLHHPSSSAARPAHPTLSLSSADTPTGVASEKQLLMSRSTPRLLYHVANDSPLTASSPPPAYMSPKTQTTFASAQEDMKLSLSRSDAGRGLEVESNAGEGSRKSAETSISQATSSLPSLSTAPRLSLDRDTLSDLSSWSETIMSALPSTITVTLLLLQSQLLLGISHLPHELETTIRLQWVSPHLHVNFLRKNPFQNKSFLTRTTLLGFLLLLALYPHYPITLQQHTLE
ncbi:DNA-directed RNA polymerase I subunit RPA49 [Grifola frondosa]|uniref:DNA-directed RNA polymerase I subunit RPA49 n=1 Tax=Grifola frondosa TaxID=5627 RepID=A0A1C7MCW5_GRIFR|nr:DNA-directed RNA polymerase I subunit RPA49 [Grifola frondosa]